jgi:hypothetical protein
MTARRVPALLLLPAAPLLAADLALEDAAYAPIPEYTHDTPAVPLPADDERPIRRWHPPPTETSQPWAQGLVLAAPPDRLDGLRVVTRRHGELLDGQLAAGYHYDEIQHEFIGAGPWDRFYVRGGTDLLSARRTGLVAAGAVVAFTPVAALSLDLGVSPERGTVFTADVQLPEIHAAVQHDRQSTTWRGGLEVRVPGSDNVWAGGISIDYASTTIPDAAPGQRAAVHALLVQGTLQWSPWNHVLLSGQAQFASATIGKDDDDQPLGSLTLGVASGF